MDEALTIAFYNELVARLVGVVEWMNGRLAGDGDGSLGPAATRYAIHRGLERWADPRIDPQLDAARQAAVVLLAVGQPAPSAPPGPDPLSPS
jgi:hypothetical protein